jgi:TRAP-type C4-dicarboxylate transport system permease small subunit
MSWFILLGAAVGVREGNHLGFEIGLHYAPAGLRRVMLAVSDVLVIGFGLAMSWYGSMLAIETWSANMAGLPIPQGMDYIPLAVGGALIALFSFEKLVLLLLQGEDTALARADEPNLLSVKE